MKSQKTRYETILRFNLVQVGADVRQSVIHNVDKVSHKPKWP